MTVSTSTAAGAVQLPPSRADIWHLTSGVVRAGGWACNLSLAHWQGVAQRWACKQQRDTRPASQLTWH
jgi:hypothetical protein